MPNFKNIALINTLIDDVRQTQKDQSALNEKKAERQYNNELFQLEKKKFEADIKQKEMQGAISSAEANGKLSIFNNYKKFLKSKNELQEDIQNAASDQLLGRKKQQLGVMRQLKSMTLTQGPTGTTLKQTLKPKSEEDQRIPKSELIMGDIVNKIDPETKFEIQNRKQAQEYLRKNLGINYSKRFPETQKVLDETFPKEDFGFSLGEIKTFGNRGKYKYAGQDKWEKVK